MFACDMMHRFLHTIAVTLFLLLCHSMSSSLPTATAFDIVNRWGATQLDGPNLQRGDPVTLRWSIVPDGKSYDRSAEWRKWCSFSTTVGMSRRCSARPISPIALGGRSLTMPTRRLSRFKYFLGVCSRAGLGRREHRNGRRYSGRGENIDGTPGSALADNAFPTREICGSI